MLCELRRIIMIHSLLEPDNQSSHRFLASMAVPGKGFILQSRSWVQSESGWLLSWLLCLHYQSGCVVGHKDHNWVRLMISFLLWEHALHLSALWKLVNRDGTSRWVTACLLHCLWIKYLVSSAIGSYHQVLEDTFALVLFGSYRLLKVYVYWLAIIFDKTDIKEQLLSG